MFYTMILYKWDGEFRCSLSILPVPYNGIKKFKVLGLRSFNLCTSHFYIDCHIGSSIPVFLCKSSKKKRPSPRSYIDVPAFQRVAGNMMTIHSISVRRPPVKLPAIDYWCSTNEVNHPLQDESAHRFVICWPSLLSIQFFPPMPTCLGSSFFISMTAKEREEGQNNRVKTAKKGSNRTGSEMAVTQTK